MLSLGAHLRRGAHGHFREGQKRIHLGSKRIMKTTEMIDETRAESNKRKFGV
ncbi:MAG: hypothetical protein ACTS5F_01905 [Candidatus Hodgkinia cicadicola]